MTDFYLKLSSLRSRAGQFRRKSNENEITCHMCHMINEINMPERIIEMLKLTCNLKKICLESLFIIAHGCDFAPENILHLWYIIYIYNINYISSNTEEIFINGNNFQISIKFYSFWCWSHPWRIFHLTTLISYFSTHKN